MKKKVIIISIVTVLVLVIAFFCNLKVEIDTTELPKTIEYGQSIKAPKAYLSGRILYNRLKPLSLHDRNNNDFSKIGDYTNIYEASFLFYSHKIEHKIKVVDKKAPVIELKYIDNHYTLPNAEYQEEGYSAYDEYDGDLTDKVTFEVKDGKVIYSVTDSSGNIATAERIIKYDDPIAPELVLNGNETITINKGDNYTEQGATANDNCDGNITEKIIVSGSVNTGVAGAYIVKYTVSDNAGNTTEKQRTITVKEFIEPSGEGKTIYLTFDDGPSSYTEHLLDVLKKYNVKATFFVVGYKCNETILKRIVNEGHSIGLHSTNHSYEKIYSSEQAFIDDLYEMQNLVKEKTGIETFLLRFPGGSSNTVSKKYCNGIMSKLTKKVEELGFEYYDWNVSSGDAGGAKTTEEVIRNIKTGVRKYTNSVVLQHDTQKFSVDAVEEIIKWGIENGYSFASIDKESPKAHHGINN